ncbi:MAG: hypothetical protein RR827_03635 [Oscillospiraceae bacterium]
MEKIIHKQHVIDLFNKGVLKLLDAYWFSGLGYELMCADGQVVDIVKA